MILDLKTPLGKMKLLHQLAEKHRNNQIWTTQDLKSQHLYQVRNKEIQIFNL